MTLQMLIPIVVAGSLATMVLLFLAIREAFGSQKLSARVLRAQQKVARKTMAAATESSGSLRRQGPASNLPLIDAVLGHLPSPARLIERLRRTGKSISVSQYAAVTLGLFIVSFGLFTLMRAPAPLAALLGVSIAIGLPHFVVSLLIKGRMKKFLIQFPDALELIVRGLRSGLPVAESMVTVSTEIRDPVGTTFREVSDAVRLGVPLEKALHDVATKLGLTEFNFFVTSISLQRETGGNLAEILANLADALRNRRMMREKIKAYASQAKASAYIVGCLPVLIVLALMVLSPGYLGLFLTDLRGNIMMAIGVGSFGAGMFIMMRMANFEI